MRNDHDGEGDEEHRRLQGYLERAVDAAASSQQACGNQERQGDREGRQAQTDGVASGACVEWWQRFSYAAEVERFVGIRRGLHRLRRCLLGRGHVDGKQGAIGVGTRVDQRAQRPEPRDLGGNDLRRQAELLSQQAIAGVLHARAAHRIGAGIGDEIAFRIDAHRPVRKVGGADAEQAIVDDHHLGMHERGDVARP